MSKKLNHEGFIIKINKVYPNNEYSVLNEYENMKTKIRVRHNCDKCNNYEWDVFPDSLLRGYSHCPKCSGKVRNKTTEYFKQEVFELVGDEYTVLGTYKNIKTKILMRHNCLRCNNHEWETYPSSFLQGHRCPICLGGIKKTPEKYNEEIFNLFGNEYSILSTYESTSKKILVRHNCKKCNNYEWEVFPHALLKGVGCLKCAGNQKKTTKSFKQEVFDLVGDEYSVLGEYVNSQTKIKIKHNCKNCNNYEYEVVPSSFLMGRRCPRCFKFWVKTTEEFEQEVFDLVGDEYSVLGEYVNAKTKIKIKHNCKDCNNYEYETTPDKFLRGSRCPQCIKAIESKGVKNIITVLKKKNIEFQMEYKFKDCKYKAYLPFDIAILKDNKVIAIIEYDGRQHFKAGSFGCKDEEQIKKNFELTKLRDSIKTKYCENNNIPLLRIKYTQFKDIEIILNHFLKNPSNYIKNHSYGISNEEYYKELKAS